MKRNVRNHTCHIGDKAIARQIMEDIELLKLCNSTEAFTLAFRLFFKQLKMNNKKRNQSVLNFLKYFETECMQLNLGRYEGIQLYGPSANNALEAINRRINDNGTFRERHVLSRFLTIASNIINEWSIERAAFFINCKIFATEPTITLHLWTKSYQCTENQNGVMINHRGFRICYGTQKEFRIHCKHMNLFWVS